MDTDSVGKSSTKASGGIDVGDRDTANDGRIGARRAVGVPFARTSSSLSLILDIHRQLCVSWEYKQ
eukprot:1918089-Lingulodinium_polyedra.AAC.1